MIILLTGAQKTGKTTLANYFQESISSIATVTEAARELILAHPDRVNHGSFQDMIYETQIDREKDVQAKINSLMSPVKVAILDRSIVDVIVYAKFLSKKLPNNGYFVRREWIDYVKTRPYDHIFLCDPNDIQFDSSMSMYWKDDAEEMRLRLHELYIKTFSELSLRYTLLSGTVEERIQTITKTVEKGSFFDTRRKLWDIERSSHPFLLRHNFFFEN